LIIGLGNPGPRYEQTRHNAGFLVVDSLAQKQRIAITQSKYRSLYGEGEIEGCKVIIAKPMTYMNNSGEAAKMILSALKIHPKQVLVIHDDIDLLLGKIKIKTKGGDGGQLGVRSITEKFGNDEFHRIRVGVGRPDNPADIVDYVLTAFPESDAKLLNDVVEKAVLRVEETLVEINTRSNQTGEGGEC